MLAVFDWKQDWVENMVIVCFDVSKQLIFRHTAQLSEAGKTLTYIPSAYELLVLYEWLVMIAGNCLKYNM